MSPRPAIIVFVFFFILFAIHTKDAKRSWGDASRMAVVESLVERGTLAIDDSRYIKTGDKIKYNGHFYTDKPPLLSIIMSAIYAPLYRNEITLQTNSTAVWYWSTLLSVGVFCALGMAFLFQLLREVYRCRITTAFTVVLAAGVGTLYLPYSVVLSNHSMSGALLLISLYYILARKQYFLAGLFVSFAAAIDIGMFLFCAVFFALLWRTGHRDKLHFVFGTIPFTLVYFFINYRISGSLTPQALNPEVWNYYGSPFTPKELSGLANHANLKDAMVYAFHMLFGYRGLFSYTPIVFVGLVGLLFPSIENQESDLKTASRVLFVGICLYLTIYILRTNNYSGYSYGVRWFASISPLCCLGLLSKYVWRFWIIFPALLYSMCIAMLGLVDPFTVMRPFAHCSIANVIALLQNMSQSGLTLYILTLLTGAFIVGVCNYRVFWSHKYRSKLHNNTET